MSRWKASIQSATHFFRSILSATLAISVTFFPFLVTMHGTMVDFIKLFPWAITCILFVSLLVAELVVPFLQFFFIRKPLKTSGSAKHRSFLGILQSSYDWLIARCFSHPYITVGIGMVSVAAGGRVVNSNRLAKVGEEASRLQLRQNEIESQKLKLNNGLVLVRMLLAQYCGLRDTTFALSYNMNAISPLSMKQDHRQALACTAEYQLLGKQVESAALQKKLAVGEN